MPHLSAAPTHNPLASPEERATAAPSCPSCGGGALTSVRAIYEQGTCVTSVDSSGGAVVFDGAGDASPVFTRTTGSFASSSLLAQRLAPPESPNARRSVASATFDCLLLGFLVPLCLWIVFKYVVQENFVLWGWLTVLWAFGIAAAVVPMAKHRRSLRRERESETAAWSARVERWAQLRYCSSCDSVLDPKTRKSAPTDSLRRLL